MGGRPYLLRKGLSPLPYTFSALPAGQRGEEGVSIPLPTPLYRKVNNIVFPKQHLCDMQSNNMLPDIKNVGLQWKPLPS